MVMHSNCQLVLPVTIINVWEAKQRVNDNRPLRSDASEHTKRKLDKSPNSLITAPALCCTRITSTLNPCCSSLPAVAAEAYNKSQGERLCAVMTTSGPGATNLCTGIASAWRDGVPMIIITSQVRTGTLFAMIVGADGSDQVVTQRSPARCAHRYNDALSQPAPSTSWLRAQFLVVECALGHRVVAVIITTRQVLANDVVLLLLLLLMVCP
jgi:hypothetical protein